LEWWFKDLEILYKSDRFDEWELMLVQGKYPRESYLLNPQQADHKISPSADSVMVGDAVGYMYAISLRQGRSFIWLSNTPTAFFFDCVIFVNK